MNELLSHVKNAGFPYWQETIHLYVGGSALHGAKIDGYDDLDIYGVYVETPQKILGIDAYEHFVWSTGNTDSKNTSADVDITLYGLRKWALLACKGNPSVLHSLFAKNVLETPVERDTWFHTAVSNRQRFLCKSHYKAFLGFASAQMMRMSGERSRNVARPDLVEKYGYDTKFAMHIIRLLVECEELLKTAQITLPSIEKDLLIEIRTGNKTQEWVLREATRRFEVCHESVKTSPLPETIDRNAISKIIAEAYRTHWEKWKW